MKINVTQERIKKKGAESKGLFIITTEQEKNAYGKDQPRTQNEMCASELMCDGASIKVRLVNGGNPTCYKCFQADYPLPFFGYSGEGVDFGNSIRLFEYGENLK